MLGVRPRQLLILRTPMGGPGPQPLPVKVSALGLMPASLLEVPKSEIFSTPL